MTASRTLDDFLRADVEDRFRWLRDGSVDPVAVRKYLGDEAFAAYQTLVDRSGAHLSGSGPANLIFVPGVMGSLLHSSNLGGVWWLDVQHLRKIKHLRLSDDGSADFEGDHAVEPFGVDIRYEPFRAAILDDDRFRHRAYAYDWRKSLRIAGAGLKRMIDETYASNGGRRIHLVAHSMGGLVVRAMLTYHGDGELWAKIGRIAFIATPHFGSPAIAGYLKDHLWGWEQLAALAVFLPRATFRSLRGVLTLLPAPADVYPRPDLTLGANPLEYRHPCSNFDLYDAAAWRLDVTAEELRRLQEVLNEAANTHRELASAHAALSAERRERMLMIAGVGYRTLFRLEAHDNLLGTSFKRELGRIRAHPHRDGDGRVPLASAQLPGVRTGYVRGVHDELPLMPEVGRTVLDWLAGENTWEVADTADAAYDSNHLGGSPSGPLLHVRKQDDDPGWWVEETDPEAVAHLVDRIERGEVPEFTRVHIL